MPRFAFNCENPIPPYAVGHEAVTGPEGVTIMREADTLVVVGAKLLCNKCLTQTEFSAAEPQGTVILQGIERIAQNAALRSQPHIRAERKLLSTPIGEELYTS